MNYSRPVSKIIEKRKSIRTYDPSITIEKKLLAEIRHALNELESEYFRIVLIKEDLTQKKIRLGTYGMIAGAQYYLVGIFKDTNFTVSMKFGIAFEKLLLKATDLGLGTCWMIGTYNKSAFEKMIAMSDNERVVIVSPLGYQLNKVRIADRITRLTTRNHTRKIWEDLFFYETWETPLLREQADEYAPVLDALRLAPSASNKQPWRVIKQGDSFHFYYHNKSTTVFRNYDCGANDVGIGMAHFELVAKELHLQGHWENSHPTTLYSPEYTYVQSWKCL